jgi:uncharacterized OsmC-like protein
VTADALIRTSLEEKARHLAAHPAEGRGTAVSRVRLREGLTCDVEEGDWTLVASMPRAIGGTGEGPTPGTLGRAAFGTCLALSYAMWAARLGVPLESVEVEVHADYDARGELDASSDVRPGYLEVRYLVRVASPAPEEAVLRVLDTADRRSTFVDLFANGVPLRRDVQIAATAA